MKIMYVFTLAVVLQACTVVPASQVNRTCQVVETAFLESDLSPQWYINAGNVLDQCGFENALERAEEKACNAQKRNGYECK